MQCLSIEVPLSIYSICRSPAWVPHFPTRTHGNVSAGMNLQMLTYNLLRVLNILGVATRIKAMKMVET
jgi:hypothetical protein